MSGSHGERDPNLRAALAYGAGDFGMNLYFVATMTYLLYFYTDVFGLSAVVAGNVFFVARIIDAVTDPAMGLIADRTRSRFGRFRPWLLYGALPLGIITVLTWTTPALSEDGKAIWAYVTYIAFGLAYTVVGIPYSALTAVLTDDHDARTRLSTVRMACAFSGGLLISVTMLPLVDAFGGGSRGFMLTTILLATVATGMIWVTFATTRERLAPPPEVLPSLRDCLAVVLRNPPLLITIGLFVLGMLGFTVRQSATIYYFKYNMGREDLVPLYFGITLSVMIVGLVAVPRLTEALGKARGIQAGGLLTIIAGIGFYFTPADDVLLVFVFGSLLGLGGTPIAVLGWAMIPDTVEYAAWRTGIRADGVVYAAASFFQKVGKTVGGAGVAWLLAMFGYVANAAQSEASLEAIRLLMTLAPAGIGFAYLVLAAFYRLDKRLHGRINRVLRRQARLGEVVVRSRG